MPRKLVLASLALAAALGATSFAPRAGLVTPDGLRQDFDGVPRVVDGDSLEIDGVSLRLYGIDAPEMGQMCTGAEGTLDCGARARQALMAQIGDAAVSCTQIDFDSRYNRPVVRCHLGQIDLNAAMVTSGHAVAYRRYALDYAAAETQARDAGRGIWAMTMQTPEEYRHDSAGVAPPQVMPAATAAAGNGCEIKGNISGNGRIYHLPGQENYADTQISLSRGERWFCSEAEAQAAGWRRAQR